MLKAFLCLFLAMALLLSACGGTKELAETSSAFSVESQGGISNETDDSQEGSGGTDTSQLVSSEQNESSLGSSDSSAEASESSDNDESEENSGEISQETSDESYGDDPGNNSEDDPGGTVEKPSAPSISSVNRSYSALDLAKGKAYKSSLVADSKYADNGKKLTDGNVASGFTMEDWAGYIKPSSMEIVLDLGKIEADLADFSVSTLRFTDYGIGSPESIQYEVSADGKVYRKIGKVLCPSDVSDSANLEFELKLAEPVSARYIRITVGKTDSAWLFLGELHVIRYTQETDDDSYYGDATLPEVDSPVYWPANAADREKTINLIAGMTPLVESKEKILKDFATEYYNSLVALPRLTDGAYAKTAVYSDSALVHFTRSSERTLLFDLGYTSAVSGILYSFLNETSVGVYAPSDISVYLSENGKEWQRVYSAKADPKSDKELCKREADFDAVYKARFVKIVFAVSSHAFCDEIQIFGTKAIPANALSVIPGKGEEPDDLGYITPDDFLGVNNVLLSYHCLEENRQHTESGLITVDEYLPHVGYYNEAGKLVDTFFDAYLYLPYTKFNYDDFARTLEGWKFYLDDIYTKDRNMSALDQAVSQVKKELSLPDYTCTVFTSVLYPWKKLSNGSTVNTFGDLDGDGRQDSFALLENRKKAVKWMMDQEYNRFLEGNYKNLEFGGFYWFEEAISVGDSEEKELILFASEYAHSLGVKFFWIPYYCASGYDRWQEYGFDLACMQPNYMFGNSGDAAVLQITADKTNELGMCVELEMNSVSNTDEVQRYMQYLAAGAEYGYMHAVKMYYQGGVPGVIYDAYCSDDPFKRAVYDLTYQFAKERFKAEIPEFSTSVLDYSCRDGVVNGDTIAEADGAYRFVLAVSPAHGDLRLNGDGTFAYYAEDGFSGVDRFAVVLDYGYAKSEEIVITITVD